MSLCSRSVFVVVAVVLVLVVVVADVADALFSGRLVCIAEAVREGTPSKREMCECVFF